MLRGIYTGASGMAIQQTRMDVIANNLANVDKTAFKRDTTLFKTFPEMLIHRYDEDGVGKVPMGSFDTAPVVGKSILASNKVQLKNPKTHLTSC